MKYGKKIYELIAVLTACLLMTLTASGFIDVKVVYAAQTDHVKNCHGNIAQNFSEMPARVSQEWKEIKEEEERKAAEEKRRAEEEARRVQEEEERRIQEENAALNVSPDEQKLLAALIFCEAGNQPYEGQVAVGAVVMNRVKSSVYPNSIYEVIYQSGQFGPAITGWLNTVLSSGGYTEAAMQAAADALAGSNPVGDCLYFGCGNYGLQIGDHFFH